MALVSPLLLAGCAGSSGYVAGPADTEVTPARATASRMYATAEARIEAEAYDDAIALLRHAILQLPPEAEHDVLRHQLLIRMAYVQLQSAITSGDPQPLLDAQQMLMRYSERYPQLFGDDDPRAPRADIFEMLYQVENRLVLADEAIAPVQRTSPPRLAAALGAGSPTSTPLPPTRESRPDPRVADATTTADDSDDPNPADVAHDTDGNEVREVVVRRNRSPSTDDAVTMGKLRGAFGDADLGLVLTRPGLEPVHGPRALVRGRVRIASKGDHPRAQLARAAGRSLLDNAREDLRECYEKAYARQPQRALESVIEASIHPDGSVSSVLLTDGTVIDALGDVCVIEAMRNASVEPIASAEPFRVRVAMTFLYQNSIHIYEGSGEQVSPGAIPLRGNPARPRAMPPIESFAGP
ncbi:MAG: hypothetical protein K0V04_40945 [Deltaproteobacteria bacterium]|nr:hypothetical protein [Deltaproteobacteria bacterium]